MSRSLSWPRLHAVALGALLALPPLAHAVPEGPAYPSAAWAIREAANYAKVLEAPAEQARNPAFLFRLGSQSLVNTSAFLLRDLRDPSWVLAYSPTLAEAVAALGDGSGLAAVQASLFATLRSDPSASLRLPLNVPVALPLCASYALQCAGDPYRWPGADPFYRLQGEVEPVVFYDAGCARLSGRVWKPRGLLGMRRLPGVVIQNGSVQAPETAYWWMAQALVRAGYTVLTFDPRGQGRSDLATPTLEQGTNINPSVFWTGLVDAIDFFRSRPGVPYPNEARCAGSYPTRTASINPFHATLDLDRLGIAGHSLGAVGISIVQGYGAPGADPWPGQIDATNPVDVAVGWDGVIAPDGSNPGGAGGMLFDLLPEPLASAALSTFITRSEPRWAPRVPTMGQNSEYGLAPIPFVQPPGPDERIAGQRAWQAAGVPSFEFTIRGSSHFEWSQIPSFPATSWCPSTVGGHCAAGFGQPMAEHYSLAWFDRWLKRGGEAGFLSADARLLDDTTWRERMSFHFRSARAFPTRGGTAQVCADIRAGC